MILTVPLPDLAVKKVECFSFDKPKSPTWKEVILIFLYTWMQ